MYDEYLEFAKEIAYVAGEIMLKYFNEANGARYKKDDTIVTKADIEINNYLIKKVKENYPDHSIDGEEKQFGKSKYVWVCDPVDGTAMYARNIPVSVFSLALVIDGKPVVGVIYDPFTNSLYSSIKNKGSYKNDTQILVNNIVLEDMKSVSNFDMIPNADYNIFDSVKELGKKTYFISIGSIARAGVAVASGELNLAIYPLRKHKNCDLAAVKLIVEEAGGKVTDLFGDEQLYNSDINGAIISNNIVHNEVVETIKKYLSNLK